MRHSNRGLRTQDSGLRTQDSGLRTQDSGLRTQVCSGRPRPKWWTSSDRIGWPAAKRSVPRWLDLRRTGARCALPPATHHFSLVGVLRPKINPNSVLSPQSSVLSPESSVLSDGGIAADQEARVVAAESEAV